ncbi:MAG: hypothetical protein IJH34_02305, partial [Romboutsia sp.]|nr:hypothetical protein [Romboutsia sp.]
NKKIEKEIKQLNEENESLESLLEDISSNNSELNNTFNTMVDENFKALPGTTWSGTMKIKDYEQETIPVSLAIKDDEIILHAKGIYWYRSENEEENYFNAQISLSSGEKNKEKGYLKLNRLSFKNPPQDFEEYNLNNVLPYNYDIFFNDTYATGYLLDGSNNIKGTMHLTMIE